MIVIWSLSPHSGPRVSFDRSSGEIYVLSVGRPSEHAAGPSFAQASGSSAQSGGFYE
jgi:hypothetical protein